MTSDLDLANIGRMPLRGNIVVLEDAGRVEEMDEGFYARLGLGGLLVNAIPDDGVAKILL